MSTTRTPIKPRASWEKLVSELISATLFRLWFSFFQSPCNTALTAQARLEFVHVNHHQFAHHPQQQVVGPAFILSDIYTLYLFYHLFPPGWHGRIVCSTGVLTVVLWRDWPNPEEQSLTNRSRQRGHARISGPGNGAVTKETCMPALNHAFESNLQFPWGRVVIQQPRTPKIGRIFSSTFTHPIRLSSFSGCCLFFRIFFSFDINPFAPSLLGKSP